MLRYIGLGLLGLFLWGVFTTLFSMPLAIFADNESLQLTRYIAQLLGLGVTAWIVWKLNAYLSNKGSPTADPELNKGNEAG